jgi:hypothetical protein
MQDKLSPRNDEEISQVNTNLREKSPQDTIPFFAEHTIFWTDDRGQRWCTDCFPQEPELLPAA